MECKKCLLARSAKEKKVPFIPWDFINDDINQISIESKDCITAFKDFEDEVGIKINELKLDLDGINLPVLALRPRD